MEELNAIIRFLGKRLDQAYVKGENTEEWQRMYDAAIRIKAKIDAE